MIIHTSSSAGPSLLGKYRQMSQDQIQIFYVPSGFEPNILSLSYKLHGAEFPNDQDKKYVDILSDKKLLAAGRIIAVNKNGKSMLGEVSESTKVDPHRARSLQFR